MEGVAGHPVDGPRAIVVMGVAGCGKSAIGQDLAKAIGAIFIEGDGLHPAENVARMSGGQPLTDELREGWLDAVGAAIRGATTRGLGAVAACSALKRKYRDRLRAQCPDLVFIHLAIDKETARQRVGRRKGHFMPASLVDSQFADLELLQPDEPGAVLDATGSVLEVGALAIDAATRLQLASHGS